MRRQSKERLRQIDAALDLRRLTKGLPKLTSEIPLLPDQLEGYPSYSYCKNLSLQAIQYVNEIKQIRSSNLPNQCSDDDSTMVLVTQKKCDKILEDESISELEKIRDCGAQAERYAAGNCQHKSFVAFNYLISKFIQDNAVNFNQTIPLSLCYFDNHFVVVIANLIVCDPWAQTTFLLSDLPTAAYLDLQYNTKVYEGRMRPYFSIDDKWNCSFLSEKDEKSELYTYLIVPGPTTLLAAEEPVAEEKTPDTGNTQESAQSLPSSNEQLNLPAQIVAAGTTAVLFKRKDSGGQNQPDKATNENNNKKPCFRNGMAL
jgi:hypothetical protein